MHCTIVSFFPQEIRETKPGVSPGDFIIPKSDGITPTIIHVGNSIAQVYLDDTRGRLPVTMPADEIAASIVNDFCRSQIVYAEDCRPGLYWVEGKLTAREIKEKYSHYSDEVLVFQKNWFVALVKMADDEWQKTKQLKAISGLQRFACNFLNLKREWNVEAAIDSVDKCGACGSIINAGVAVCPNCRAILDEKRYNEFKFASA